LKSKSFTAYRVTLYIHEMNQVNCCSDCHDGSATNSVLTIGIINGTCTAVFMSAFLLCKV